ncbi:MAG: hypothetical protein J5I47_07005 [Vicingus serpentipes]|nr:hypothetical protein [Vicingus serpentipes]
MNKKKQLTLLILNFIFLLGFAQVETKKRIEFELKEGYESHDLAQFKDNGILFYSKSTDKKGKTREWKIEQYNTSLELKKTEFLTIPKDQYLGKSYTTDTDLYMFFSSKKGVYSFFKINARTLKIKKITGTLPSKAIVFEIHVINDIVFFDAKIKKSPMLFKLNLQSERQDLIPITLSGYDPKYLSIEDIQVIEEANEVMVYINAYDKKEHDLYVIQFNNEGDKKSTFNLTKGHDMKLSSVSASYLGDNAYAYTGTYSDKSSTSSQGVYLCKTKGKIVSFFKFYNFLDFDKFLSYLPEKKQEKIEKKKVKKAKKGKEFKLDYRMASHDIMVINGQFVYLGEAYYATYRTETYTTYVNGKATTSTRTVFDGYQYTHAVIAGFNEKGEKLWDNTFEMWPSYKPYYAKKFITSSIDNDKKLNLLFASRTKIKTMSFYDNGEVYKENDYSYVETNDDEDKVKYSYSNLEHWYDKYFLAHGRQTIKNKTEDIGKKKRSVYFINKVSYR